MQAKNDYDIHGGQKSAEVKYNNLLYGVQRATEVKYIKQWSVAFKPSQKNCHQTSGQKAISIFMHNWYSGHYKKKMKENLYVF